MKKSLQLKKPMLLRPPKKYQENNIFNIEKWCYRGTEHELPDV